MDRVDKRGTLEVRMATALGVRQLWFYKQGKHNGKVASLKVVLLATLWFDVFYSVAWDLRGLPLVHQKYLPTLLILGVDLVIEYSMRKSHNAIARYTNVVPLLLLV